MTIEILLVLAVVLGVLGTLMLTRISADGVMLGALAVLAVAPVPSNDGWRLGVISADEALKGFGNSGLLTVAALFVIVTGLRETGAVDVLGRSLLGTPRTVRGAIARLYLPVCGLSAFLNNTPLVAILIPAVSDMARRCGVSPSRLLIPLSFAAILGGTITLIGTSTNLLVVGLMSSQTTLPPLGIFDIAWIGIPVALVGGLYLVLLGPSLLPDRRSAAEAFEDSREFTAELLVPAGSPLHGLSIAEASLRQLPKVFVLELERDGELLPATPDLRLKSGDRLVFVGAVEAIRDLQQLRGLAPVDDQVFKVHAPRHRRRLYEAVVGASGPLVGRTVKEARFRTVYDAAVIAVARQGQRVPGRIGDITMKAGDTLLVEGARQFDLEHRRDFLLIRGLEDSTPRRHDKSWLATGITLAMVLAAATEAMSMLQASLAAGALMVLTRCCSIQSARDGMNWSLLLTIGAAIGLGKALEVSGAAPLIGGGLVRAAGSDPWLVLAAVYLATMLLTEVVTNNAAAAIVFAFAQATAAALGVSFLPFAVVIMFAASACFSSPIGYQTNLMVMGPGGYRFGDYLRIGIPLNLLVGAVTVLLTPLVFPFHPAG